MLAEAGQEIQDLAIVAEDDHGIRDGGEQGRVLLFAGLHALEVRARAEDVSDPMTENRPVNWLGDEVGGACLVGVIDGAQVLSAGRHHNRNMSAARKASRPASRSEACRAARTFRS